MDDFESKLRNLSTRSPSDKLDERIFALADQVEREGRSRRIQLDRSWSKRRVPLWGAAAAALLLTAIGFAGGALLFRGPEIPSPPFDNAPTVRMQVIYTTAPTNPFDFTDATHDFPPETMNIRVRTKGGV